MYEYDRLLNLADTEGISVVEKDFKSDLKGLCIGKKIAIDKNMSETEKRCVLAEELGHYYMTVGNIIDTENSFIHRARSAGSRHCLPVRVDGALLLQDKRRDPVHRPDAAPAGGDRRQLFEPSGNL